MSLLPDHVLAVLLASTFLSSLIIIFGSMCLYVSPVVWVIPAAVVINFIHHLSLFLVRGLKQSNIPRVYTMPSICFSFLVALAWLACLAISVTFMALLFCGRVQAKDDQPKVVLGILSGLSLIETALMGFLAIRSIRERKQIRYTEKWTWRTPRPGFSQADLGHKSKFALTLNTSVVFPMFYKS